MSNASGAHEVGPLAEEAAKLFGALSGWARDHAAEASDGLSGMAAQAVSMVQGIDEHPATGSAQCRVCPLCHTIEAVRRMSPEVTTHLANVVVELAQVAAVLLAPPGPRAAATDDFERIDLDDKWSGG